MNASDVPDLQGTTTDVGAQRIARVYAEALLNAAQKHGQVEAVLDEVASVVRDVFTRDPRLEAFLATGAAGRKRKAQALEAAFRDRGSDILTNFLLVLNDHDRLDLLRPILAAGRELHDERARRVRVQVQSAVPLPNDQRERLTLQLRQSFHLEPVLDVRVDADLLGGLVVRVGDWVYDASVRAQLGSIRNQLIASSSHEIQGRRDRFSSPDGN